jgi:DNA damage-binding protein 1
MSPFRPRAALFISTKPLPIVWSKPRESIPYLLFPILIARTLSVGSEITTVAMFASASSSPTVAVGTWTNEILLFNLDKIDTSAVPLLKISESFYASSIILKAPSDTAGNLQVLAGLSDGSLITYELGATADGKLSMTGRKVSSLGSQPLALHSISGTTLSGDEQLLAVGLTDRMSILYGSRDTVEFSSVSLTGIAAATAVSLPAHGRCLVLATATGLSISKDNGLKKLHIQTMDLGFRSTHKLAWMPEHKSLAAGSVERRIDSVSGDYWQKSFVEIRDRSSLQGGPFPSKH